MKTIAFDYDVASSPDKVFAFLTDFDKLTQWRTLESMRVDPPGPLQVGSRLYSKVKGPGQTMEFENRVTELDPARRRYADVFVAGTFPIESSWDVKPHNGGARITWRTNYAGKGLMSLL